jgi:hypothetical protein
MPADEMSNHTTSAPADERTAASSDVDAAQVQTAPAPAHEMSEPSTEKSTEGSLFAGNDLSGLRSRWDDVQASFVDDPKDCVQKADGLVADVVQQLTTGFSEARSRLESQWARGEEASTEDLRQALKRYREFFERLLAV